MAVAVGTAPLERLREALADARAAGVAFDEAWMVAGEFLEADVRAATVESWRRSYYRMPATRGDEAVCRLAALVGAGVPPVYPRT